LALDEVQICEMPARAGAAMSVTNPRTPLFGSLPARGLWTALDLTRGQFVGIVLLACVVYAFAGGPLWRHLGENDFLRIVLSYALIPLLVAAALAWNHALRLSRWLVASGVLATLKLVLTALLAVATGIYRAAP
jgi:hypothetical protein